MTEFLIDECYSCIITSLALIKHIASERSEGGNAVIETATQLSQTCIVCIRSHEAGSVLPQTADRLAEESQRLVNVIQQSSMHSPEAAACSLACENVVRTYHQAV